MKPSTMNAVPIANENWVLLYNDTQDAWHVETMGEYQSKPSNGFRLIGTYRSHTQASWAGRTLARNPALMGMR